MKALVLREFGQLVVERRPDPLPEGTDVVVQVTATGICGSDLHGYTGENGRRHPGQVMGHETVGRVVALGPRATKHRVGQLVTVNPVLSCGECTQCGQGLGHFCPGRRVLGVHPEISAAFAELLAVPERNVVPLPETMPEEYGALIEPLAVGYHAARRADCPPGAPVLVIGGGPIGQSTVLACRRLGAGRVVVAELDAGRRDLCARLGAETVDPTDGDLAGLLGDPVPVVIDAVGTSGTLADALACSAIGGRVVLVGMHSPRVDLPAYAISTEERTLLGSFCYSAEDFLACAEWAGSAPPELAMLIEERVGLADAPAAFRRLADGAPAAGKVLVRCNGKGAV